MNHGRIEQVDDPVSLYNRPKSRFVAGFIGRTNILDGRRDGDRLVFPGFSVAAVGLSPGETATSFSIRPQTIGLHRTAPSGPSRRWWLTGQVVERAYLGEYWEYVVRPTDSDLRLRVSTAPNDVFATNETVWLEIDPTRIAPLPGPDTDTA